MFGVEEQGRSGIFGESVVKNTLKFLYKSLEFYLRLCYIKDSFKAQINTLKNKIGGPIGNF